MGSMKVKGRERRQSLQRAHRTSGGRRGWHGDSVDSTTPSGWSVACPPWHSVAYGLRGSGVVKSQHRNM